jgi:hypothetical protein
MPASRKSVAIETGRRLLRLVLEEAASLIYRFAQVIATTVQGSYERVAPLEKLIRDRTGIVLSAGGAPTLFG